MLPQSRACCAPRLVLGPMASDYFAARSASSPLLFETSDPETGEPPQIRFPASIWTRRNMSPGLENRRMKGHGGQDRCLSGRVTLNDRNRSGRERQLRQARRNGESLQQRGLRGLKGVAATDRMKQRHWHPEHLHHDANAEQHDQAPACRTATTSHERLIRHPRLSYDVRSPKTRITRKL